MNKKSRTKHDIILPRHLVHKAMEDLDPDGLEEKSVQKKVKKKNTPLFQMGQSVCFYSMVTKLTPDTKIQLLLLVCMIVEIHFQLKLCTYLFVTPILTRTLSETITAVFSSR